MTATARGQRTLRIGTRASALALTQTGMVAETLRAAAGLPEEGVELVRVRTEGDRLTGSLSTIGGTGVFVAALREAILAGRCDLAVHSLKDLPTTPADGLVVAAIPGRADVRDALCARDGLTLADLPDGARVGTGSPRRAAQLRAVRPDLVVVDIRGNVDTRLGRVAGLAMPGGADGSPGDLDAVVLAAAGLGRLGRLDAVTDYLDPDVMLPAPGQGALAIECRPELLAELLPGALVPDVGAALAALDHLPTRLAVTAERSLLAALEAGCSAPIGALGHVVAGGSGDSWRPPHDHLRLDAVVCRPDGTSRLGTSASVALTGAVAADLDAARSVGTQVAEHLLSAGAAGLAGLGGATVQGPVS